MTDEPVRGGAADLAALTLSGADQLRALLAGLIVRSSNSRLTGHHLAEVADRSVVFAMPISGWLIGPRGSLHPGVLALLGDQAMTGAVIATLPPGVLFATAELSVTFLSELPGPGGELTAVGEAVQVDGRAGVSTARISGPGGTLLGFGTSRVCLEPPLDLASLGSLQPPPEEPPWPTPDPCDRTAEGVPVVSDVSNGLAALAETLAGIRPRPPIDRLVGIHLRDVGEGHATFSMAASPWLTNELGVLSGGMLALLAESAVSAAAQSVARPGARYRAVDLKVNLLRSVPADGADVVATGQLEHSGRLAVAGVELRHGGRVVAVATGTTELWS